MKREYGLLLALLALTVSGCASLRGAPPPLLKPKDIDNATFVDAKAEFKILSGSPSKDDRDAAVLQLVALSDLRYMHFRENILVDRKATRSASDGLILLTDIAATLTNSVGVKDNYIALSALVNGGSTIYDKEFLFEKTIDALVTQMDASRAEKRVEILQSLALDIDEYPGESALVDVIEYYYAGTLNGAITGVQKSATRQQTESMRKLQELDLTHLKARTGDTRDIVGFVNASDGARLKKLRDFLIENGQSPPPLTGEADTDKKIIRNGMNDLRREKQEQFPDFRSLKEAFKKKGIVDANGQ